MSSNSTRSSNLTPQRPALWLEKGGTLLSLDRATTLGGGSYCDVPLGTSDDISRNSTSTGSRSATTTTTTVEQCVSEVIAFLKKGNSCSAITAVHLSLDIFNANNTSGESSSSLAAAELIENENGTNNNGDDQEVDHCRRRMRIKRLLLHQLLECIERCLPKLQSLRLYSSGGNNNDDAGSCTSPTTTTVDATMLARIISSHATTLQTLVATRCLRLRVVRNGSSNVDYNVATTTTTGNDANHEDDDVQVLAASLREHPTLRDIKLLDLFLLSVDTVVDDNDGVIGDAFAANATNKNNSGSTSSLDPIVTALSTIRQLESVDISLSTTSSRCGVVAPMAAAAVRGGTTGGGGGGDGVVVGNQQNDPHDDSDGVLITPRALQALLTNCQSLTDVTLWNCALVDAHLEAIGAALQRHETLQFLSLRRNANIGSAAWCHFYRRTLEHCYSLQSLYSDHADGLSDCHPCLPVHRCINSSRNSIGGGGGSSSRATTNDEDDAANAPSSSATTTIMTMMTEVVSAVAAAELYLGLNQLGRAQILRTDDPEEWCAMLHEMADAPSALYALISERPTLFL